MTIPDRSYLSGLPVTFVNTNNLRLTEQPFTGIVPMLPDFQYLSDNMLTLVNGHGRLSEIDFI